MSWEVKRLDELVSDFITKGATPTTTGHDWAESGIPFLRSECVSANGFEPNGIRYITPAANTQLARSVVRPGDVLISITGNVGRVVRYPASMPPGNINQHIARVRIERDDVLPDFVVYQLLTPEQQDRFGSIHVGAAYPLLSLKQIRETEVRLPPLPEQKRIVGKLDAAFAALTEAQAHVERNRANARELFESKAEQVFGLQNEEWPSKLLGDLCRIRTGKKDVNQGNPNGAYPFFTCAAQHTFSEVYSFDAEALLIAGNGDVGHVTYYEGKFEAYQRTYVLTDFIGVSARYLYQALDGRLKRSVSRQKLGNTMPYIKVGMLSDFVVPLPDLKEQSRIVEYLEALKAETLNLEATYQQKLTELTGLKKAVLGAAFRGEL